MGDSLVAKHAKKSSNAGRVQGTSSGGNRWKQVETGVITGGEGQWEHLSRYGM